MLLTLTTTASPATDLGFLLHKHPDRAQSFDLPVGRAHVVYPEASESRCTVALLLEVDPVGLVRGRRRPRDGGLAEYVNDRPYAASSLLATALGKVFSTAMRGECAARPELAASAIPLIVRLPAVPSRGGPEQVERLFAPLGWQVDAAVIPLDPTVPQWGQSRYVDLTITGTLRLSVALSHIYVLLPVLDGTKHYWVGSDEVDKLVRRGAGWLHDHPEREWITRRYLAHKREFVTDALARLSELDGDPHPDDVDVTPGEDQQGEVPDDVRVPLVRLRTEAVLTALRQVGAQRVVDLGCGSGALLRHLLREPQLTEIVGVDVSASALEIAERRLRVDRMSERQAGRLTLRQSSATYRDTRLAGYDAVVLMEVVEHVDPDRLPSLERNVFGHARPSSVVVTTPNVEYNPRYQGLEPGAARHPDHRFEWTRAEFAAWTDRVCGNHGYDVEVRGVGDEDPELGSPTQLALFRRRDVEAVPSRG